MTARAAGTLWALALATALSGCASKAAPLTQLSVRVDSDLDVPAEIDRVKIAVTGLTAGQSSSADLLQQGFPRKLTLVHDGGPLGPITVTASGWLGGTKVVEQAARASFVQNKTSQLSIRLDRACLSRFCDSGQTCKQGSCSPISGGNLNGAGDAGMDAGADGGSDAATGPDDGGTDAAPADAAPADGGGDAGGSDGGTDAGGSTNLAPICRISRPSSGQKLIAGTSVQLRGSCSDPESGALSSGLQWSSNLDGALGSGAQRSVPSLSAGTHILKLCATDPQDSTLKGCASVTVMVGLPPPPTASITSVTQNNSDTQPFSTDTPIDFAGAGSGQGVTLSWLDSIAGAFGNGSGPALDAPELGKHRVTLTVRDNAGQSATDFVTFVVLGSGQSQLISPFSSVNTTINSAAVNAVAADSANQVLIGDPTPQVDRFDGGHATSGASAAIDSSNLLGDVLALLPWEPSIGTGLIYAGTSGGLSVCNYTAGATIDTTTCKTYHNGMFPDNQVNAVARVSGTLDHLVLGTNKGVFVPTLAVGSNNGTVVLDGEEIAGLAASGSAAWIASGSSGLDRYDPTARMLSHRDGGPSQQLTALAVGGNDTVWVGSNDGIGRYEPSPDRWTLWQAGDAPAPGLASDSVRAIAVSQVTVGTQSHEVIWIGTDAGVSRFDPSVPSFTTLSTSDGLPSDDVRAIAVLPNGSKVLGTAAGVALYTGP